MLKVYGFSLQYFKSPGLNGDLSMVPHWFGIGCNEEFGWFMPALLVGSTSGIFPGGKNQSSRNSSTSANHR